MVSGNVVSQENVYIFPLSKDKRTSRANLHSVLVLLDRTHLALKNKMDPKFWTPEEDLGI